MQTHYPAKTRRMRISLSFSGITVNDITAELIWKAYELMTEKGDDFSIKDGAKLQTETEDKYRKIYSKRKSQTAKKNGS